MSDRWTASPGIPFLPPELTARPRLTGRMRAALDRPLTLLSAPSGCGKTVLLAEWSQAEAQTAARPRFAWLSLHESDSDPRRFWTRLGTAIDRTLPGLHSSPGHAPPGSIDAARVESLGRAAAQSGPIVLVLDDYHFVGQDDTHAGLAAFIDHLPPRVHVVLASQADPPLPLPRWRADGRMLELREADLRLTGEEAARFLHTHTSLKPARPLRSDEIEGLAAWAEHRIAALQWAALALREQAGVDTLLSGAPGGGAWRVEDLAETVVRALPARLQAFLLQTSILDRLCAPLCQALTGDESAQATLDLLQQSDLFTTRWSGPGPWYQYHRLFADWLRNRLFHTRHDMLHSLHQRASDWHAQAGLPGEAIRHALAADDPEQAARLIARAGPLALKAGEVHTVLGWLGALPEARLRSAALCLLHAQALLAGGHAQAAARRLAEAESASDCGPEQRAEIEAVRAAMRF